MPLLNLQCLTTLASNSTPRRPPQERPFESARESPHTILEAEESIEKVPCTLNACAQAGESNIVLETVIDQYKDLECQNNWIH